MVKHTRLPQGAVKRLSLSILIDHAVRFENGRRLVEPPAPEKIKVIHDLVAATVGLDTNRGDQLVVEAFPFESTLNVEPAPSSSPVNATPASPSSKFADLFAQKRVRIGIGIGAGILISLVAIAIFWLRKKKTPGGSVSTTPALHAAASSESPEDIQKQIEGRIAAQRAESARAEVEALMSLKMPAVKTKKTEVLMKHIASETQKDPGILARTVRTWLNG